MLETSLVAFWLFLIKSYGRYTQHFMILQQKVQSPVGQLPTQYFQHGYYNAMHYGTMLSDFPQFTVIVLCTMHIYIGYTPILHQNCTKAAPELHQKHIATQPQCSQWVFHLTIWIIYWCTCKSVYNMYMYIIHIHVGLHVDKNSNNNVFLQVQ